MDDTALVGEQEPELTMDIKDGMEVETFAPAEESIRLGVR